MNDDLILRTRIFHEEKAIKRLYYKYSQVIEEAANDSTEDKFPSLDQFLKEIHSFELLMLRHIKLQDTLKSEAEDFRRSADDIRKKIDKAKEEIKSLEDQLVEARKIKENKLEYDNIALEILKLPSRQDSEKRIEEMKAQKVKLEELAGQQTQKFLNRKLKLTSVFQSLYNTLEEIKEDKPFTDQDLASLK